MVNCTNPVSDCLYNLSAITNGDLIVTDTASWLQTFDSVAGGFMVITFLAMLGLVLFVLTRELTTVSSDSEAMVYASLITTVIGVLLFLIPTTSGAKLVTWVRLIPFVVILLVSVFMDFINRRYH